MAADSQNCSREAKTMSQIETKEAVDGNESSPTKGKMTDLIENQPLDSENGSSDPKMTENEQSDSSLTQSPLDVIVDGKQGQMDSVNDVSDNTQQTCPQVTQENTPTLSAAEAPGEDLTENSTKMDCNSSTSESVEPSPQQNDTSSNNKSCDVKSEERVQDVLPQDNSFSTTEVKCNSGELKQLDDVWLVVD